MEYLTFECGCKFPIIDNRNIETIDSNNTKLPRIDIDIYNLPLDCKHTWDLFATGRTRGIWQLETPLGQSWSAKFKPRSIDDLAILTSILRPGCLEAFSGDPPKSMTQRIVDRKNGDEEVVSLHPLLDDILNPTQGALVFQEQSLQIVQKLAGFSLEQSDLLRRCIAKGSLVYTQRGKIPIEHLKIGDKIITVDNQYNKIYRPITNVWSSGKKQTIKVTSNSYSIATTKNHQFLTQNWITKDITWKRCDELSLSDNILCIGSPSKLINEIFWQRITSISISDFIETYDYEVGGEEHCGFINGILVHNSLGKKDPALMQKVKEQFLEGCKKTGTIEQDKAEEIFSWIKAGERYSFNKAHGVCYGMLGYITAYIKTHFPVQFIAAYLRGARWKQDSKEEIYDFIQEARSHNIKIYGPNISILESGFTLVDDGDNNGIYYGFTDIKGIGYTTFLKFIDILKTTRPTNWIDYLINISDHLDKTTNHAFIQTGIFDFLSESRTKMLFEYDIWSLINDKEKEWFKQNFKLTDDLRTIMSRGLALKRDGGCANTTGRLEKLSNIFKLLVNPPSSLDDKPHCLIFQEEQLLGSAITYNRVDTNEINNSNITCQEFKEGNIDKKPFIITAEIKRIKNILTKNNTNMMFVDIADNTGQISVTLFPKQTMIYRDLLQIGNVVSFYGHRDKKYLSFIVDKVE